MGRGSAPAAIGDPLVILASAVLKPYRATDEQRELVAQGYARVFPDSTDTAAMARLMRRNPIGQVRKLVIECTTRCNYSCGHCYNAGVERITEMNAEALSSAIDTFAGIGVREFAFIGGEVSKYGDGWLGLARKARDSGAAIVSLLSNGWFLGGAAFEAAGRRYADDGAYLRDLKSHGVTHVGFSLDGRGQAHDDSRGMPGSYARILKGFGTVLDAGLQPRVSLLARSGRRKEVLDHFDELLSHMYRKDAGAASLLFDNTNAINDFVDLGNHEEPEGDAPVKAFGFAESALRCPGFYRPSPQLTIKANGELATCRLADAGEGYGNIHERPLLDILNGMQDSYIYRLHAERRIGDYLPFVDPNIFGRRFSHLCALRAVTTMIASRMRDQAVEPGDAEGVARINREVAAVTGRSF
jgi:MoaA/NifB/PqqE/SkfB family radical SAM enzyme